ncbi:1-deoxy-D-xylulose-5-phosphate synthase, partial [Methylobacterium gossipiicola]
MSEQQTSILDGLEETSALRALPESELQAVADAVRAEM